MIITIQKENDVFTFTIEGKLDSFSSPKLQDKLLPAIENAKKVKLDFTNVEYISSAGLRVLLLGEKTARAKNKIMYIFNVSEKVMNIFIMTGFADMLYIEKG